MPSSTIPRDDAGADDKVVPRTALAPEALAEGIPAFKVFQMVGIANSGGAARRLIEQGGAYINNQRVTSIDRKVTDQDLVDGEILLRSGKKNFHKIVTRGVD